jgi:hypothetical protein
MKFKMCYEELRHFLTCHVLNTEGVRMLVDTVRVVIPTSVR